MIGWIGPDQTAIYPLLLLGRHHPPTPTYCIIITLPPTYLRTYGSAICGMEGDFSPTQHIFITVVSFPNSEQAQTEESRRDVIRYSIFSNCWASMVYGHMVRLVGFVYGEFPVLYQ